MVIHHARIGSVILLMEILLNHHKWALMSHDSILLLSMRLEVIENFLLNFMGLVLAACWNFFIDNGCEWNGSILLIRDLGGQIDVVNTCVVVEIHVDELLCAHLVFEICESILTPLALRNILRVLGVIIVYAVLLIINEWLVLLKLNDLWVCQALHIKLKIAWLTANALLRDTLVLVGPFILLMLASRVYRGTVVTRATAHALPFFRVVRKKSSVSSPEGARRRLRFLGLLSGLGWNSVTIVDFAPRFLDMLVRNDNLLFQRSTEVIVVVWVRCLVSATHWPDALILRWPLRDTDINCCVLRFCLLHLVLD